MRPILDIILVGLVSGGVAVNDFPLKATATNIVLLVDDELCVQEVVKLGRSEMK